MAAFLIPPIPLAIFGLPPAGGGSVYGISFDLWTHGMTDDLGNGWAVTSTGHIYKQIQTRLVNRGYVHPQGSVYRHPTATPLSVWVDMVRLREIRPLGIIPTVLTDINIYHIASPVLVATNPIRLGGAFSPVPFGPTPVGLIPPFVPAVPLLAPPNPHPVHVKRTANALLAINWAMWWVRVVSPSP